MKDNPMINNTTTDNSFVDLEIRIFQQGKQGYPVEITLGGQQEFPRGHLAADILSWANSDNTAMDGQRLLEMLLADGALRSAWAEARGQAAQRRLRLRIDTNAAELHALPWESLQEGATMLSAQADTPFSRYLPIALPWGGPVEERPIRVLVIISDPDDIEEKYNLARVDAESERQMLESAFENTDPNKIQMDFLDPPVTPKRLEKSLRDGYHILYYLGHGAFSAKRKQAVLYVQDDEGHTRLLLDEELASMLARQGVRPRLVFLAACQSATRSAGDAFLGMAPKLVSVGVPAVVAMQDLVMIESALTFSATFYQRLLEHGQVDLAVNEARGTLLTARRPDAAVPVLFMRLKSGQLWGAEADARGEILGVEKPRMFWKSLIRDIRNYKCTPIIGPRVHGRWLPTPQEMARCLAKANKYPFADEENLARVTQYLTTTSTGRKEYNARCEFLEMLMAEFVARLPEELRPKKEYDTLTELIGAVGWEHLAADDPNETHRVLARLGLPLYLTTNYDSFMVEALTAEEVKPVREICRWNGQLDRLPSRFETDGEYELNAKAPMVYHLFGSDEEANSLVLTEDHYCNFLVQVPAQQRIPYTLREALEIRTLLFIGYGLYDWEFRVLMHALVATLRKPFEIEHVAVQFEFEEAREADKQAVQTFLQQYFKDADINVFWGSAVQFVAELREHWEARNG
jgi:hypothetical protein